MLNKNGKSILIAAALALLALGASACDSVPTTLAQDLSTALAQNLPVSLAPATSTPTPTDTPTPAPTDPTPSARAPQRQGVTRAQALQGFAALLKRSGLTGGVVTSNDGSALGVKLGKTSARLQVASNAIVVVPGVSNATVSNVQVGDRMVAAMNGGATGMVSFLLDFPASYKVSNLALAAVQSNNGGTLTLRARGGTRDVITDASTIVVNINGGQPALGSVSDLQPGNAVLVIGDNSGGAFNAQVIVVLSKNVRSLLPKGSPPQPTPGA
jgi:hypothetical protein